MAGGKGKRITSDDNLPKPLRIADGKTLLSHVLETISFIPKNDIIIVVGYEKEQIINKYSDYHFAVQDENGYGTGYAVKCGMRDITDYNGEILVLSGDVPLIKSSTVSAMIDLHRNSNSACTILSCRSKKQIPFGRIIRVDGKVTEIKEYKDCSEEERKIDELNVATYIFEANALRGALAKLKTTNAQGEYYLTDVPKILLSENKNVEAYVTEDENEMLGVNTQEDLDEINEILRMRRNK